MTGRNRKTGSVFKICHILPCPSNFPWALILLYWSKFLFRQVNGKSWEIKKVCSCNLYSFEEYFHFFQPLPSLVLRVSLALWTSSSESSMGFPPWVRSPLQMPRLPVQLTASHWPPPSVPHLTSREQPCLPVSGLLLVEASTPKNLVNL